MPLTLSPAMRQRLPGLLRKGALALLAGAVLGTLLFAGLAASVDFSSAERAAIARLEQSAGIRVAFAARQETRFPSPRVIYENLNVTGTDGVPLVVAGAAEVRFTLFDIIDGTLDSPTILLRDASMTLEAGALSGVFRSPRSLVEALARFTEIIETRSAFQRLTLSAQDGRLALRGAPASGESLGPFALGLDYSAPKGRLALRITQAGSGAPGAVVPLSQQAFKLALSLPTPGALRSGASGSASLEAALGDSRFSFSGHARQEPDLTLTGTMEASVGEAMEALVGWQRRVREVRADPARLAGQLTLDSRGIGLDGLTLTLGRRALNGIATLRTVGSRWSLSSTLAGDLVDGTAAHLALQDVRDAKGAWSQAPLSLNPLPQMDLDLRLSSRAFRLGKLALSQVALSVLTRANRTEMAIVDSRFGEGSFKARVVVGESESEGQALRLNISADGIDWGEFMEQGFALDRLTGTGSFVVQAQGQGRSVAALVGSLEGTAALDLRNGVINGIDLTRLMNRAPEQRAETALLFSLVGKTAFESLRSDFAVRGGRLETVGSRLLTKDVDGVMEGYSDLSTQQHRQTLVLRKRGDGDVPREEFFGFRMEGALLSPNIKPDARLLQERRPAQ